VLVDREVGGAVGALAFSSDGGSLVVAVQPPANHLQRLVISAPRP
jgi:hypothetical protein